MVAQTTQKIKRPSSSTESFQDTDCRFRPRFCYSHPWGIGGLRCMHSVRGRAGYVSFEKSVYLYWLAAIESRLPAGACCCFVRYIIIGMSAILARRKGPVRTDCYRFLFKQRNLIADHASTDSVKVTVRNFVRRVCPTRAERMFDL